MEANSRRHAYNLHHRDRGRGGRKDVYCAKLKKLKKTVKYRQKKFPIEEL